MPAQHGLQLLESCLTLALIAGLVGLAAPSVGTLRERSLVRAQTAALSHAAQLARSTAIAQGSRVVLCPGNEQCVEGLGYDTGWLVFVDRNGDGRRQPGEAIVERQTAARSGVRILPTSGRPQVVYLPNGAAAGSNVRISICPERTGAEARSIVINNAGRLRVDRDPANARCR